MLQIRDAGGTLRTVTGVAVRDAGGVLRTVQEIRVRDAGNVPRTVFSAFATGNIVASPDAVYGYAYSHAPVLITTSAATVTVTGGSGSYTYSWAAGDVGWAAVYTTAANTPFRSPSCGPGDGFATNFICTVTDTVTGLIADSNSVSAQADNYGI